jgi:translation initiation factor 2 gamma subunit (eIF-2gamma)
MEREQASWRHLQAQIRLVERQASWEPWKALAAMLAAAAIMAGAVLALSNWIGRQPQTINVHLDAPIVVQPK